MITLYEWCDYIYVVMSSVHVEMIHVRISYVHIYYSPTATPASSLRHFLSLIQMSSYRESDLAGLF